MTKGISRRSATAMLALGSTFAPALMSRAVRAAVNEHWGKKPPCLVHVLTV